MPKPGTPSSGSFGERATALVRSYKRDLDRNRSVLRKVKRELTSRTHRLTEVQILNLLIWSLSRDSTGGGAQSARKSSYPDRGRARGDDQ